MIELLGLPALDIGRPILKIDYSSLLNEYDINLELNNQFKENEVVDKGYQVKEIISKRKIKNIKISPISEEFSEVEVSELEKEFSEFELAEINIRD